MAISNTLRIYPELLRSLGFDSISGTYAGVGNPLEYPARIVKFQNTTDEDVYISWDGINDHQYLPANGSFDLLDVTTNKTNDQGFYIPKNQRFYVKQASGAPTLGSLFITSFYGINEGG